MFSELECGICYRTYNAGRRCPRELRCKHTFCESCLLTLSRPRGPGVEARRGAGRSILCPLCRRTTSITGEGRRRVELPVDECVLGRLLAAGTLDKEEEDQEEEEEGEEEEGEEGFDDAVTLPETSGGESESFGGNRRGRLRRSWKNVWRRMSRWSSRQRGGEIYLSSTDMRNLALMSCYML